MAWGVVRVGDGYVVVERLGGGRYRARPALRAAGRRTTMLEGTAAEVLPRAWTVSLQSSAARFAERLNGRTYDPEGDRWSHLDR